MANVEHSALTGSSLHEPKGVAAASANTVYVADGAASGSWTTVSNSVLASAAKAFQAQLFHIQDQKASGTDGGTFTSGSWQTRTLNTSITNEITSASLAANQITLPSGTYYIEAWGNALQVDSHKIKLYNTTDASDTLLGSSEYCGSGSAQVTKSVLSGRFTIGSAKVFELRHRCSTTNASNGYGNANTFSVIEVYADVRIWKVA